MEQMQSYKTFKSERKVIPLVIVTVYTEKKRKKKKPYHIFSSLHQNEKQNKNLDTSVSYLNAKAKQ